MADNDDGEIGRGIVGAMMVELGPKWYPIAIVVTALPCAWLGGVLFRLRRGEQSGKQTVP